ncbi:MAG: ORF6N domain-containing protein [Bacteroidales bacterium]|nr:ORF6N domain-containing protein [Bacteroidales bacterium]
MADLIHIGDIQNKIYTVRGKQVMLDSVLAEIYDVETRVLNQAVKRNADRFPDDFMFKLTDDEFDELRSHIVTIENQAGNLKSHTVTSKGDPSNLISQIVTSSQHGGTRKLPNAFTEQGVSMLSAVLRSKVAVDVSVSIIRAFAEMRKFIATNADFFNRLSTLEKKQLATDVKHLETDKKIDAILQALEEKSIEKKQGVFYDGQIFDAYAFVCDLIKSAKTSIKLVDNYVDETVLEMLTKRKKGVNITIFTRNPSKTLKQDTDRFNAQYPKLTIEKFDKSHDRFLIIDDKAIYHFGASLKDLGKKWFAFTRMEIETLGFLNKLNKKD